MKGKKRKKNRAKHFKRSNEERSEASIIFAFFSLSEFSSFFPPRVVTAFLPPPPPHTPHFHMITMIIIFLYLHFEELSITEVKSNLPSRRGRRFTASNLSTVQLFTTKKVYLEACRWTRIARIPNEDDVRRNLNNLERRRWSRDNDQPTKSQQRMEKAKPKELFQQRKLRRSERDGRRWEQTLLMVLH